MLLQAQISLTLSRHNCSFVWRGLLEYITYQFAFTSLKQCIRWRNGSIVSCSEYSIRQTKRQQLMGMINYSTRMMIIMASNSHNCLRRNETHLDMIVYLQSRRKHSSLLILLKFFIFNVIKVDWNIARYDSLYVILKTVISRVFSRSHFQFQQTLSPFPLLEWLTMIFFFFCTPKLLGCSLFIPVQTRQTSFQVSVTFLRMFVTYACELKRGTPIALSADANA